jgi:hypothetical protein
MQSSNKSLVSSDYLYPPRGFLLRSPLHTRWQQAKGGNSSADDFFRVRIIHQRLHALRVAEFQGTGLAGRSVS